MDRIDSPRELKLWLEDHGVPVYLYSIGKFEDDAVCMTLESDGHYCVFTVDRGQKNNVEYYVRATDACSAFISHIDV